MVTSLYVCSFTLFLERSSPSVDRLAPPHNNWLWCLTRVAQHSSSRVSTTRIDERCWAYNSLGTNCDSSCDNQVKFDTSKSSSYKDGGKTTTISFATGVGVDPVINDDYVLTLRSGTDTVTVAGVEAGPVSLFTITQQTPAFGIDPFSGIQGMSAQAQGFFAALIQKGLPCRLRMNLFSWTWCSYVSQRSSVSISLPIIPKRRSWPSEGLIAPNSMEASPMHLCPMVPVRLGSCHHHKFQLTAKLLQRSWPSAI